MEYKLGKIVILVFLSMSLFAKDYFHLYREQGIKAVEKELEKSLTDKNSWREYLEDKNIDFGYYETKKFVILAQKNEKEMSLYEKDAKGFNKLKTYSMIIGENSGDKLVEGDKKTPEGVYELTQRRTGLDQFYGPLALVTSYPNTFEKSLAKTGHGIWIHGMPLNGDRELFTQGCLAIGNNNLESLDKVIDYKNTILITTNKEFKKASKDDIALILSSIYKWRDTWKYSKTSEYLDFYSKDFKRSDRSDFNTFAAQKTRIFSKNESKTIKLFNIDIAPYPNSLNKNMYKVLMDEEYFSPTVTFIGKKELFIEVANNKVQILSED